MAAYVERIFLTIMASASRMRRRFITFICYVLCCNLYKFEAFNSIASHQAVNWRYKYKKKVERNIENNIMSRQWYVGVAIFLFLATFSSHQTIVRFFCRLYVLFWRFRSDSQFFAQLRMFFVIYITFLQFKNFFVLHTSANHITWDNCLSINESEWDIF